MIRLADSSVFTDLKGGLGRLADRRIAAERLYLRPPHLRDWPQWEALRGLSRPFLEPWEPVWPDDALTRAHFQRRLRRQLAEWRGDQACAFLIFRIADERLVGGITIANIRRGVAQMASVGYWIGAPFARRGYMTEALVAACGFAFAALTLHRVEAACLPHNDASRGLLEKVGFEREGYAKRYLKIAGEWQDHLLFGMSRERFEALARGVEPSTTARSSAVSAAPPVPPVA